MNARPPVVLTIAGSDPSGGAGVQADLRVFTALGVTGLSAITALTIQNSQGVRAVHPVSGSVLYDQIAAVLEDTTVGAVKIGMLAGAEQVRAVADALNRFRPPNVVLDPVLASTAGYPLLASAGLEVLLADLVPLCDLVTPNIPELESLPRTEPGDGPLRLRAARALLKCGAGAVLIKGGHLPDRAIDVLVRQSDLTAEFPNKIGKRFVADRVETPHTHGTGCFLSSAIAANLALGMDLVKAIDAAKRLLTRALATPVVAGTGRGYPNVVRAVRRGGRLRGVVQSAKHAARLRALSGALYVVTDSELRPDRSAEEIAREAVAGGASIIQLRDKRLSTPALVELAKRLTELCRQAGALLIVNDRVDVALAADADGVHLGPDDMHPADARRVLGPDRLIGVSTGTVEEALALAPYASYLGVGAIFGSKTKQDAGAAVGPGRITGIRSALGNSRIPIVAIGGISAMNIGDVAQAGADCAAVVSAVIGAADMRAATKTLLANFRSAQLPPDQQ